MNGAAWDNPWDKSERVNQERRPCKKWDERPDRNHCVQCCHCRSTGLPQGQKRSPTYQRIRNMLGFVAKPQRTPPMTREASKDICILRPVRAVRVWAAWPPRRGNPGVKLSWLARLLPCHLLPTVTLHSIHITAIECNIQFTQCHNV